MGLGPIVIPLDRSRTEAAHLPFRNETVCRATELIWARSPLDPIAALYRKRAPLPVCEKLPRRLAFEHPLYCALAVGVIASPSVKAAAMVKTLPMVVHFLLFMRNLPFCLIDQATKSSACSGNWSASGRGKASLQPGIIKLMRCDSAG